LNRGWRLAAFAVLIITAISWMVRPDTAGFVGGGAWLVLLLVPALGLRKTTELAAQQRFAAARRLSRVLRFLHPADALLEQSVLLEALERAQRGEVPSALSLLARVQNQQTNVGRQAIAQSFRIRGDWSGLLAWFQGLPPGFAATDFALLLLYLRALGENGLRDELVLEFARVAHGSKSTLQSAAGYDACLLLVLAFCGRVRGVVKLFETKLRKVPRDVKEFWIATAELAAGQIESGTARLEKLLAQTDDHLLRNAIERRLARASEIAVALLPGTEALLQRIEQSRRVARTFASQSGSRNIAVMILIGLNLAMFTAEIALGGSTDPLTLHRLGQLELSAVLYRGEYWRLLTALFLHYGPLHLAFNLYALFVIGPGLEQAIGSIRFAICYLLAGLGSSLGVLFLWIIGMTKAEQLVGASGCLMGLVGVWAGLLLRERHAPLAGRRLKNILMIVAIQTAFDLSTPQISIAAHMSGLVSGVALGLILAPHRVNA
jgi:rhomboid protease GluP